AWKARPLGPPRRDAPSRPTYLGLPWPPCCRACDHLDRSRAWQTALERALPSQAMDRSRSRGSLDLGPSEIRSPPVPALRFRGTPWPVEISLLHCPAPVAARF